MDYMGQELAFSAGKPEGNRMSSETLGDTEWNHSRVQNVCVCVGGADKSRTNKSYKVRGCNLGLHDDMSGFFTSSAENYRNTTRKTAGEEEKRGGSGGRELSFAVIVPLAWPVILMAN